MEHSMKQNMETTDRLIRVLAVAPALLVLAYLGRVRQHRRCGRDGGCGRHGGDGRSGLLPALRAVPLPHQRSARRHDLTRGQDPASTAIVARSVPVLAV